MSFGGGDRKGGWGEEGGPARAAGPSQPRVQPDPPSSACSRTLPAARARFEWRGMHAAAMGLGSETCPPPSPLASQAWSLTCGNTSNEIWPPMEKVRFRSANFSSSTSTNLALQEIWNRWSGAKRRWDPWAPFRFHPRSGAAGPGCCAPAHAPFFIPPLPPFSTENTPDAVLQVVLLKGIALLLGAVPANGRHVEHALAKLDKGAALDGQLDRWEWGEGGGGGAGVQPPGTRSVTPAQPSVSRSQHP